MVKKATIPIVLIFIAAVSFSFASEPYEKVIFVYDGDTVLLANKCKVRYLGINCPEMETGPGSFSRIQ